MNTELPDIEGISMEMLVRYIEMRRRIDVEAKTTHSLVSMPARV